MSAAAQLFAERGYRAVSTVELGEAVGMSGPALYNYFPSKEALLCELLIDVSTRLLAGCLEITSDELPPDEMLDALLAFHAEFATSEPDIIVLQDRELANLPSDANRKVRRLQREYLREWERVLETLHPEFRPAEAQTRLLATFGLLNSTPHSARAGGPRAGATRAGGTRAGGSRASGARAGGGRRASGAEAAVILAAMARAALTAPVLRSV